MSSPARSSWATTPTPSRSQPPYSEASSGSQSPELEVHTPHPVEELDQDHDTDDDEDRLDAEFDDTSSMISIDSRISIDTSTTMSSRGSRSSTGSRTGRTRASIRGGRQKGGKSRSGPSGKHYYPVDKFAQFYQNPYISSHLRMMISVLFGIKTPEGLTSNIPSYIESFLRERGEAGEFGRTTNLVKDDLPAWRVHYEVFHQVSTMLIRAAGSSRGWDLLEAYSIRRTKGSGATYRSQTYPSWTKPKSTTKQNQNADQEAAAEICIPDDVGRLVLLGLFGSSGLIDPTHKSLRRGTKRLGDIFTKEVVDFWRVTGKSYVQQGLTKRVSKFIAQEKRLIPDIDKLAIAGTKLKSKLDRWSQIADFIRPGDEPPEDLIDKTVLLYEIGDQIPGGSLIFRRDDDAAEIALEENNARKRSKQASKISKIPIQAGDDDFDELDDFDEVAVYNETSIMPDLLPNQDNDDLLLPEHLQKPSDTRHAVEPESQIGMGVFEKFNEAQLFRFCRFKEGEWPNISKIDNLLSSEETLVPLKGRLHQYMGATVMLSRAWAGVEGLSSSSYSSGVLVSDETSMGKTLQAILFLGAVSHYAHTRFKMDLLNQRLTDKDLNIDQRQALKREIIGIRSASPAVAISSHAAKLKSYMAKEDGDLSRSIEQLYTQNVFPARQPEYALFAETNDPAPPRLPHIIVVPPGLVVQWSQEILRYTTSLRCHVVRTWRGAKRVVKRIQSMIENWKSYETEMMESGSYEDEPEDRPHHQIILIGTSALVTLYREFEKSPFDANSEIVSLFQMNYATLVFDEAHKAKSPTSTQTAVWKLATRSSFRIGQTATPLVNGADDVCYISNALNFTQAAGITNVPKDQIPQWFERLKMEMRKQKKEDLRGVKVDATTWYIPTGEEEHERTTKAFSAQERPSLLADHLKVATDISDDLDFSIKQALGQFSPYIIKRSPNCTDQNGKPLLRLGGLSETILNVTLTDPEVEDIVYYLEDQLPIPGDKEQEDIPNGLGFYGPAYISARSATLAPAFYANKGLSSPQANPRRFQFTKMNCAIDIIMLIMEEEKDLPDAEKSKFAVHSESVAALAQWNQRILSEVNQDASHPSDEGWDLEELSRILTLSPAGELGLNAWRCNVVIQLRIGRHRRTPPNPTVNPLQVRVFSILALNSTDVVQYIATLKKGALNDRLHDLLYEGAQTAWAEMGLDRWNRRKKNRFANGSQSVTRHQGKINDVQQRFLEQIGLTNMIPYISCGSRSLREVLIGKIRRELKDQPTLAHDMIEDLKDPDGEEDEEDLAPNNATHGSFFARPLAEQLRLAIEMGKENRENHSRAPVLTREEFSKAQTRSAEDWAIETRMALQTQNVTWLRSQVRQIAFQHRSTLLRHASYHHRSLVAALKERLNCPGLADVESDLDPEELDPEEPDVLEDALQTLLDQVTDLQYRDLLSDSETCPETIDALVRYVVKGASSENSGDATSSRRRRIYNLATGRLSVPPHQNLPSADSTSKKLTPSMRSSPSEDQPGGLRSRRSSLSIPRLPTLPENSQEDSQQLVRQSKGKQVCEDNASSGRKIRSRSGSLEDEDMRLAIEESRRSKRKDEERMEIEASHENEAGPSRHAGTSKRFRR
ncbi:uncharacterized protein I303_102208 [Kwoniella dejecticola CBS 10117]|uniref:Helicase ATP-binding domain-containing protein n=1 Tax=Kwoniella dejecticola CBS 10117 TaxID=1296121 RepID=A0AAJ8KJM1_9TREE